MTLNPIQMGMRVYVPSAGRFLQVDPIEGGVENSYVYPPDPVNDFDLEGKCTKPSWIDKCTRYLNNAMNAVYRWGNRAYKAFRPVKNRPVKNFKVDKKITKQMTARGWDRKRIEATIKKPSRTVPTRDTRHMSNGKRRNDPATAFYNREGGYVVRNNRTGDIVQVSNMNKAGWRAPWD